MKKVAGVLLLVQLTGVGAARAQTGDDLQIEVNAFQVKTNGAEQPAGVALSSGPVSRKSSATGRFSVRACGAFTLEAGAEGPFEEGSTTGWRVEITPLSVNDGAVTFRLRWILALDSSKQMSPKSEDIELTMRPGESRSLDSAIVPPDRKTGRPCPTYDNRGKQIELSRGALRVSVEYTPHESREQRLVGVDLWLIERLPTGTDHTQSLAVRGLPHREMPFYFDPITDNALSLDIHGHVVARPESDGMAVEIETRSRWGPAKSDWRADENVQIRGIDSRLRMKPGETVEIALRPLDSSAGSFAERRYAIRVRARQLR